VEGREFELIEIDDALTKLARESERAARVAEPKVFAGLTGEEMALALGVPRRTVTNDWTFARMWLARELRASGA
jgi:DNA-directed RNA polymerase specialized sigma24 family protein